MSLFGTPASDRGHGANRDRATVERRRVYDTTAEELSNGGQTYGDALSDADRDALLEYLRSL
jgi:hypothetical protein